MVDNIDSLLSLAAGVPKISIERFDEKRSHLKSILLLVVSVEIVSITDKSHIQRKTLIQ